MKKKTVWTDVQLPVFGEEQLKEMTYSQAEEVLMSKIYEVTLLFEQLEHARKIHGNAHHLRQKVSHAAKKVLKEQWIK